MWPKFSVVVVSALFLFLSCAGEDETTNNPTPVSFEGCWKKDGSTSLFKVSGTTMTKYSSSGVISGGPGSITIAAYAGTCGGKADWTSFNFPSQSEFYLMRKTSSTTLDVSDDGSSFTGACTQATNGTNGTEDTYTLSLAALTDCP
jgi:hypothetical protein